MGARIPSYGAGVGSVKGGGGRVFGEQVQGLGGRFVDCCANSVTLSKGNCHRSRVVGWRYTIDTPNRQGTS